MCANHDDDFDAIVDSIKLGFLFCWSIVVLNRHVFDASAVVDGVDGELGSDQGPSLKM